MRYVAFLTLFGLTASQTTQLFNFTFNVGLVDSVERSNWCSGERNTCDSLCGSVTKNTCDPNTLNMECTCSNGTAPGLQYYDQSLYSFVCRESFDQCNENNAGNKEQLDKCETDIRDVCGTLTVAAAKATSGSGGSSGSSGATPTGEASSSSSNSGIAPTAFPGKGAAVVVIGLAAALV